MGGFGGLFGGGHGRRGRRRGEDTMHPLRYKYLSCLNIKKTDFTEKN